MLVGSAVGVATWTAAGTTIVRLVPRSRVAPIPAGGEVFGTTGELGGFAHLYYQTHADGVVELDVTVQQPYAWQ